MHWNRSALILFLCSGFCALNFGCAAIDAIVSSPAGHSAQRGEAKRMAAIGRVFENQGHYRQAQVMYRRALKAQPGNIVAQERLQYIASMQAEREFRASEESTLAAVAMADSLTTKGRPAGNAEAATASKPADTEVVRAPDVADTLEQERDAVMASLQPAKDSKVKRGQTSKTVSVTTESRSLASKASSAAVVASGTVSEKSTADVSHAAVVSVAAPLVENQNHSKRTTSAPLAIEPILGVADEVAERLVRHPTPATPVTGSAALQTIDLDRHRDTVTRAGSADVALTFLETNTDAGVARVSYSNDASKAIAESAEPSSGAGAWKSTGRVITLNELLQWTDAPIANRDNLLFALTNGEDDGVKALAAAMLAECPLNDREVDAALDHACQNASDVLKLSARDVLIQRGRLTEQCVTDLLNLMQNSGPEVRAQAAASLRNCAGSQFSSQCVAGLGRMLNDRDPEIVAIAATTLGDFGAEAVPHRDRLIYLLATTDNELILDAVNTAVNRVPPQ